MQRYLFGATKLPNRVPKKVFFKYIASIKINANAVNTLRSLITEHLHADFQPK